MLVARGVAPTTLLKECHDKPEMEHTNLAGLLPGTAPGSLKNCPSRIRGLATIRQAIRLKHSTYRRDAFRDKGQQRLETLQPGSGAPVWVHNPFSEHPLDAGFLGWIGRGPGFRARNCAINEFAPVPLLANIHDSYNAGSKLCAPALMVWVRNPQLVGRVTVVSFRASPLF